MLHHATGHIAFRCCSHIFVCPMDMEPAISWDHLDSRKFILNGSLFIFLTDFILYPSDLLTTKLQVDRTNVFGKINLLKWTRQILKYEGFSGIYKGFTPTLLASFPGQLSYYFTYEFANHKLSRFLRQKSTLGPDTSSTKICILFIFL